MTKQQIKTMILQEYRIRELEKRNKALESGYQSLWKMNERLRRIIKKKEKLENELNKVNT